MFINHMVHQHFPGSSVYKLKRSNNHLGIEKINCIKDNHRHQLILVIEGDQLTSSEVYAFLKGNNLFLEAPIGLDFYTKPVRTHLIGEENLDEFMDDNLDIGFSEINLDPNYHYTVLSSKALNPGLFKVILNYRPIQANSNDLIN